MKTLADLISLSLLTLPVGAGKKQLPLTLWLLIPFLTALAGSLHAAAPEKEWNGDSLLKIGKNWSLASNWHQNSAPTNGDDLLFPASADVFTTTNNIAGLRLHAITFDVSGYQLFGNPLALSSTLAANHPSGTNAVYLVMTNTGSRTITCANPSATLLLNGDLYLGTTTLTLSGGGTSIISGVVSGTGSVVKDGTGTVIWKRTTSTFTGTNHVRNGFLRVEGGITKGAFIVESGGTLGGYGTDQYTGAVGDLTVQGGGTLSPGPTVSSPLGHLQCTNVVLSSNSTFRVDLINFALNQAVNDQLIVRGTVTLDHANLAVALGYVPAAGDTFTIIDNYVENPVVGTFKGLPQNSVFFVNDVPLRINYQGGTGNDVVLTVLQAGAFATNQPLHVPRCMASATLLPNGKVLIAGGNSGLNSPTNTAEIYDPTTGTNTPTGSLTVSRYFHTATLLLDGRVLFTGGVTLGLSTMNSAELYDPATGHFITTNAMTTGRQTHSATLLTDGRVLVVGGADTNATRLSSAELYDPASGSWTLTAAPMNAARQNHTATLLANGKVLVCGGVTSNGTTTNSAELYDPATGFWTLTSAPMSAARAGHTATLLPDGKVLVAGGYGVHSIFDSAEMFDPALGTWSTVGSLHTPRCEQTATLMPDGNVLLVGGRSGANTLSSSELYVRIRGTWATNGVGSLATGRHFHTATLLPNAKVLITGGEVDNAAPILSSVEQYDDPNAALWASTGNLTDYHVQHTATLLPNGKVLIAGGYDAVGEVSRAELYDPIAGTNAVSGEMLTPRGQHTATLLANGNVLVTGGYDGVGPLASAEIYDLATGNWTAARSMIAERINHTATLLRDGKVLVTGAWDPAPTELYDPAYDTWTTKASLNQNRIYHTATLLPNGKVLVAGGQNSLGAIATAELYEPSLGTWAYTGAMTTGHCNHTATLLPGGKVLIVGGYGSDGLATLDAELYDPATGTWAQTGPPAVSHIYHTATLLPNGKVLMAGGVHSVAGITSGLQTCELYDPATGSWQTGSLPGTYYHTATLLPNGKVLTSGGTSRFGTELQHLYDVGLDYDPAWQPQISAFPYALNLGGSLALTGSNFRGLSEASGGNGSQSSAGDCPVVQLLSLHNEQTLFLSSTNWRTNSYISAPVTNFPAGYALVTVFVNGIPSGSGIVLIAPSPSSIVLSETARQPDGTFQFGFSNAPGTVFSVLATTNLDSHSSNWSVLGQATEDAPGHFQFTDPQAASISRRFYRIRSP